MSDNEARAIDAPGPLAFVSYDRFRVALPAEVDAAATFSVLEVWARVGSDQALAVTLNLILWDHAGAQDTLTIGRYAHLVGGCRMGSDPEQSVVNADHQAWDVPNLFVADGSVMPTQGSANPALTIMALASRLAERLDRKQVGAGRVAVAA